MKSNSFHIILFTFISIMLLYLNNTMSQEITLHPRLGVPFGTIVNVKAEIIDGDETLMKQYAGEYLLKVVVINNVAAQEPIVFTLKDETGELTRDGFELYKILYSEKPSSITSDKTEEMNKNYVGKIFNLLVYEAGEFAGIPNGYFDYQPIIQGTYFGFEHYLVVISVLNE